MKLLVAIPCLNEEKNIGSVISDIFSQDLHADVEVLVVDDGSTDDTVMEARKAGARVISHTGNKGLGIAFQTAMDYAARSRADIMVNMDGDGQFDPSEISRLIEPIISKKADVVMGSRFISVGEAPDLSGRGKKESKKKDGSRRGRPENMPPIKYFGNILMARIVSHLCRERYWDVSCGFRAYSRETILKSNFHGRYTYTQEAFIFYSTQNLKILEVPIGVRYFLERKSRIAGNLFKYGKKTLGIILSLYRDYYPMRLFGSLALIFLLLSVGFGIPVIHWYLATGYFRQRLAMGCISVFSMLLCVLFEAIGIIMQGSARIRENQNRILYFLKKEDES